jgi:tetratricopeptide (TPR) repeat protein
LPEGVSWFDLDFSARRELQGLPKELAERVGGQLAAAGLAIDDDPAAAYAHAACARRLASRVAVTREALGLAAYAVGKFDQALAELRAYRRLSGDESHLPLVADCERGIGRPVRAIELAGSPAAAQLDADGMRELRLVVAGARCDMGQPDAAVLILEQDKAIGGEEVTESLVRLRYAYADALLASGRADEARRWMTTVAVQDARELTDAKERSSGWQQTGSGDAG